VVCYLVIIKTIDFIFDSSKVIKIEWPRNFGAK
jgi:hypothetical protein